MIDAERIRAALDAAAFSPSDWPKTLETCRDALGASMFFIVRFYEDGADALGPPERAEAHLDAYRAGGWFEHDLRASALPGMEPDRLYTDECLRPEAVRTTAPFYRDFAARQDVPYATWWLSTCAGGAPIAFSAMFGAAHGPVRPDERAVLSAIQAPAAAALSLSNAIQLTEERGALKGLEMLDTPAIGLDQRGRPIDATSSGARLLEACFDLDSDGRLTSAQPAAAAALGRLHSELGRRAPSLEALRSFRVHAASGNEVICTPLPTTGMGSDIFRHSRVILVLRDLSAIRAPGAAALRDVFNLTPTEQIIASRVAAGEAPAQIALQRGVSTATVRTILRNIFRKTGVNRQSELAALLAQLK